MSKLPKKFKKQIISFCKEYESLACPHKVSITIPKKNIVVTISWWGENKCEIDRNDTNLYSYADSMYESKEVKDYNEKIQDFINRTYKFGKKYFSEKDWLWENVLWNYRPEHGEKFDPKKIGWE